MTPTLRIDRRLIRAAAHSTRYLQVAFRAPSAPPREERHPLAVAFVIDRSGSMGGNKIRLAKHAVQTAIRMLRPEDLFAVVAYDNLIETLVPATRASSDACSDAVHRLSSLDARGSTDLHTGWLRGCEQIADSASADTVARCLLLSDGLANHGVTDRNQLADQAGHLRTAHVATSTFGIGADFDERLLDAMAHQGGGNFYFIEHDVQIPDMLTSELGEALEVTARGVGVTLDLPRGLHAELLHQFRSTTSDGQLRVELGDLVSSQDVSFIVKVTFPSGQVGDRIGVRVRVSSKDETLAGEADLTWEYADHAANDQQERDRAVDRLVAEIYAARARRDAVEQNRAGDYQAARRTFDATAARIREYAGDDVVLNRLIGTLRDEGDQAQFAMSAMAQKQMHYQASSFSRHRDASGRALRGAAEHLTVEEDDGHLFVHLADGRRFLLGTGSPVSIADDPAAVAGEVFRTHRRAGPVTLDVIRREVHARIDGLLGWDVLGQVFWHLDVQRGTCAVSRASDLPAGVEPVPCELYAGVPVIDIIVEGRRQKAFFETGAWSSYMPAADAIGRVAVETREDFLLLPSPWRFSLEVYPRTIQMGSNEISSLFGVLPDDVPLPSAVRGSWIIGAQVIAQQPVAFDPATRSFAVGSSSGARHLGATR